MKENIGHKVKEYLGRKDEHFLNLSPEKEGTFEIIGGSSLDGGFRKSLGIYRGKYSDVIAHAIGLRGFYGEWAGNDVKNINNGYIKMYNPIKIVDVKEVKGLTEYIKLAQTLEKKEQELDEEKQKLENIIR